MTTQLPDDPGQGGRRGLRGICEYDVRQERNYTHLNRVPVLPDRFLVSSVFSTNASEIHPLTSFKEQAYNFRGTFTWFETGLQILSAAGRGPDCPTPDDVNTGKLLPPKCRDGAAIIIGSLDAMDWVVAPDIGCSDDIPLLDRGRHVEIAPASDFERSPAYSCCVARTYEMRTSWQAWLLGWAPAPVTLGYLRQVPLLRGCRLLLQLLEAPK